MNLDVGCGRRKLGDLNVDLDRKVSPDVVCSINYLPFQDGSFEKVFCYHVLEHRGVKPLKAVRELLRLSKGLIEIQVPHWLGKTARGNPEHVNYSVMHHSFWNPFHPAFIWVEYSYLKFFPFLTRPSNLNVVLKARMV